MIPPYPSHSLWVGPMDSTQDYGCFGICLCVQVVKELLSQGADPNLPLTKGLGTALCVVCDLVYEQQRSIDNKIALVRGYVGGCRGGEELGDGEYLPGSGWGRLRHPKITSD